LRVRKPATGEHRKRAPANADAIIREMAGTWSDEHVAATLNRITRTPKGCEIIGLRPMDVWIIRTPKGAKSSAFGR